MEDLKHGQQVKIIVPHTFIGFYPEQPDCGVFQEYDGNIVVRRLDWIIGDKNDG